jgi:hypothetical protein
VTPAAEAEGRAACDLTGAQTLPPRSAPALCRNDSDGQGAWVYGRPLLTTRLTLAPCFSRRPALGFCEIT